MESDARGKEDRYTKASSLAVVAMALGLLATACGSATKTATPGAPSATSATGSSAIVSVKTVKLGQVLVNTKGMTLYTFDPENSGTIVCATGCTDNWPPDLLPSGKPTAGSGVSAALSTITRPDGGIQVTAAGHPLYNFSGDKAPGDTNGDGVGGKWHAARPNGMSPAATPSGSSTTVYSRY